MCAAVVAHAVLTWDMYVLKATVAVSACVHCVWHILILVHHHIYVSLCHLQQVPGTLISVG